MNSYKRNLFTKSPKNDLIYTVSNDGFNMIVLKNFRSFYSVIFVLFFQSVYAQKDIGIWKDFEFFLGEWEGHQTGKSGIGKGERTIEFIMQGKYLHWKNKSTFEPQEKNPKGEVHEDWAFISYDKMRKKFVMRQFHVEGFVNQYILDSVSSDSKKLIFVSEVIENVPADFRARLTYEIKGESEFFEYFELVQPGKDFMLYTKNHWKKK
ncbi:MAG: hypothetical protein KKH32_04325 [Bacteroidetes bacterium]|nr:hypothetical protein [Bacteroidota bacterium]